MFLAQAVVVFVGVAGGGGKQLTHQLEPVLHHVGVESATIPSAALLTLTHHGEDSREIVRKLHVDGVIGGEIVEDHGKHSFRLVIYKGNGTLKSLSETSLAGRALTKGDLEVLGMNLEDDVASLAPSETPAEPAPVVAPVAPVIKAAPVEPPVAKAAPAKPAPPKAEPAKAQVAKAEPPKPAPKPVPAKAAPAKPEPPKSEPEPAELSFDNEVPAAIAPTETAAAPKEVAAADKTDSVSLEDVEALTAGGEVAAPIATSILHLHAGVGLGLVGRVFSPGPSTVTGYSSTPVGAIHFEGGVEPSERTMINVIAERTLQMNSPVVDGMAATTMSRWEVAGGYTLVHGAVNLSTQVGIGRRAFSIDSTDPSRSPDGDYTYLVVGARASKALGSHVALRGGVAFEPVVAGVEPTEMAFGEATRWAVDAGAALEVHLSHVFARMAFDYQRFTWSWDAAGTRGAGGASDSYPSATMSLGAEY